MARFAAANDESRVHGCARVNLTATAWEPDGDLELDDWASHGRRLGQVGRCAGWWIGDWLNYGHHRFGERYVRASRITGYDVQTLMNMAYVASHIETSQRREGLSWSHHAEVVALPPQDQARWLDRALDERLSVRCLREEIRRERRMKEAAAQPDEALKGKRFVRSQDTRVCPSCGQELDAKGAGEHAVA